MTFETSQTTLYRAKSWHACSNCSPDSFELSNETGLNITIVFNFKKNFGDKSSNDWFLGALLRSVQ